MPDKKIVVFVFFLICQTIQAQSIDSLKQAKRHRSVYLTTTLSMYTVSNIALYKTWYEPYSTGKFHAFNDQKEWFGMDKTGHFITSWWISSFIKETAEMSGFNHRQAKWMGIIYPTVFMTSVEVMDGFSNGWGFSTADLLANFSGIGFAYLQSEAPFFDQFNLKYSWNPGELAQYRPNLLGRNVPERMLKNYNEQTYWLSVPLSVVHKKIPNWLCISIGYGANGMLGAKTNVWEEGNQLFDYSMIERERQFSLSLDLDLRKIKIKGKAWKLFTSTFRWLKIPAPALHFNSKSGFEFSPIQW
jgi:uncharacterized protein YfiM (DUF2279 family)